MQIDDLGKKPAGENEINWVTAIAMFAFHAGALAALFFFSWKPFLLGLFLYLSLIHISFSRSPWIYTAAMWPPMPPGRST